MNNFNGKDVLHPFLTHKNVRIMKLVLIMLTVMLFRVSGNRQHYPHCHEYGPPKIRRTLRRRYADHLRNYSPELPSYDYLSHDWNQRRNTGNFKLQLRGQTDKASQAGRETYPYINALLYYVYVSCVPVCASVFCKALHIGIRIHGMLYVGNPHLHNDDYSIELSVCIC